MQNPFEIIAARLSNIEALLIDIKHQPVSTAQSAEDNPYADFNWLCETCKGVPASTLRIKSAAGDIPGVIKFGKRVLYEKAVVLNWLRSQTKQPTNGALLDQQAEEQFARQLNKKGGVRA